MIEKSNTQRILAFFFTHPTREIHLRELSREMGLSMPAILSAVKKLQKEGFVLVKKGRALTTVRANIENGTFRRLKRLHNIESLYVSGFVDFLYAEFRRPQAIVCFGSYSRGDDTEGSDIDIALIGGTRKDVTVDAFERVLKRSISTHVVDPERISKEFRSNLCNGIVLEGAL